MRPWPLLLLILGGCLSVGESERPSEWSLDLPSESPSFPVRVFLPAELRRPSVVTREPGGPPVVHPLDRWSAPLASQLAQVVGAELAGLPLRSVTVSFRRLEAGREGARRAEATVDIQFASPAAPLVVEERQAGATEMEHDSLGNAVEAYQAAGRALGKALRARVQAELGVVAKPAGAVTVPGK